MSQIHWANPIDGSFSASADWVGGVVPGAADDAILDAAGAAYTVSSAVNQTVSSLQTASNATLDITGGVFTATGGTGVGANAGVIKLELDQIFAVGGAVANPGLIALEGRAKLEIAADTTLSGGGVVEFDANELNKVLAIKASVLTNVNNTITNGSGGGTLGNKRLTLVNEQQGVIAQVGNHVLTLDTGAHTIVNAGLIEATGPSSLHIISPVVNTGVLKANPFGLLFAFAAVGGAGKVVIDDGSAIFGGAFSERVTFIGTSGQLKLGAPLGYHGVVRGFSHTGGTSLYLVGIAFVSPHEATYSGDTTGGVLTVTDGTNTAHIKLKGDYTTVTFVCDNTVLEGGVNVVAQASAPIAPSPALPHDQAASPGHRFIAAMAGFGASAGGQVHPSADAWRPQPHRLAAPRLQIA